MPIRRDLLLHGLSLPLYWSFRATGSPVMSPLHITLGVTYRCAAWCRTCNAPKIKGARELTVDEYKKIFAGPDISPPLFVTITGGEPFAREDIADVLDAIVDIGPRVVRIHTCGDNPDLIRRTLSSLTKGAPRVQFLVLLSADALGEELAKIRRSGPEAFELLLQTYRSLRQVGAPNLIVGFQLLVSRHNEHAAAFYLQNIAEMYPDIIATDMAFGSAELDVTGADVMPDLDAYQQYFDKFVEFARRRRGRALHRFFHQINFRQAKIGLDSVRRMKQAIPCQAGHASIYISPAGVVRDCAVAGREMGNLRESQLDLMRILRSVPAQRVRGEVRNSGCFCSMSETALCSLALSPRHYPPLIASIL